MRLLLFCAVTLLVLAAGHAAVEDAALEAEEEIFGALQDGREVTLFTLRNGLGMEARISEYGASLVSLRVPDREGKTADIVLGYDSLEEYEKGEAYFGATVGRYANRIANARFELDGRLYQLQPTDGPNSLHGGVVGFNKRLWKGEAVDEAGSVGVALSYLSPHGEEGFPGNLAVTVRYALSATGELEIEYSATTDAATHCNLTHHSYFNLGGHDSGEVVDQRVMINADLFTPLNGRNLPSGEILRVDGTAVDLRLLQPIGLGLASGDPLITATGGYDHNYVLNGNRGELSLAATAWDPQSGRRMQVWTDEPGLQFYSGIWLNGRGKDGARYGSSHGFCLEPQGFPDSPNQQHFPSTVLRPGERYQSRTVFRFDVE